MQPTKLLQTQKIHLICQCTSTFEAKLCRNSPSDGSKYGCADSRRGSADLLQVGCEHHHRHEHGPLLDLAAEAEDGVLLEALLDVEDVLVLESDEADLLQPPHTGLLDELHHRLQGSEEAKFTLRNPAGGSERSASTAAGSSSPRSIPSSRSCLCSSISTPCSSWGWPWGWRWWGRALGRGWWAWSDAGHGQTPCRTLAWRCSLARTLAPCGKHNRTVAQELRFRKNQTEIFREYQQSTVAVFY